MLGRAQHGRGEHHDRSDSKSHDLLLPGKSQQKPRMLPNTRGHINSVSTRRHLTLSAVSGLSRFWRFSSLPSVMTRVAPSPAPPRAWRSDYLDVRWAGATARRSRAAPEAERQRSSTATDSSSSLHDARSARRCARSARPSRSRHDSRPSRAGEPDRAVAVWSFRNSRAGPLLVVISRRCRRDETLYASPRAIFGAANLRPADAATSANVPLPDSGTAAAVA